MSTDDILSLQSAIDDVDGQIIELLRQRFVHSREIGAIKTRAGRPLVDPDRVQSQRTGFVRRCREAALDPEMAEQLILVITNEVIAERLGKPVPQRD